MSSFRNISSSTQFKGYGKIVKADSKWLKFEQCCPSVYVGRGGRDGARKLVLDQGWSLFVFQKWMMEITSAFLAYWSRLHPEDQGPSTDYKDGRGKTHAEFTTAFSLPVCKAENKPRVISCNMKSTLINGQGQEIKQWENRQEMWIAHLQKKKPRSQWMCEKKIISASTR